MSETGGFDNFYVDDGRSTPNAARLKEPTNKPPIDSPFIIRYDTKGTATLHIFKDNR